MLKMVFLTLLIIGIVVFFLIRVSLTSPQSSPLTATTQPTSSTSLPDHAKIPLLVGTRQLTVEVVNTPASITQGLSGRSTIGSDGMLFLFDEKRIPYFWMKEMQFDLDLVWISDETVVGISEYVPHPEPTTPLDELPHYAPPEAVDAVLEIPAGKADEWGIKPGDPVVRSS